MSSCRFCDIVKKEENSKIVYEDDRVVAFMPESYASLGHIIVIPKSHYTIFEMMPDDDVAYLFEISNKLSIAVFESLGIQGTNMIMHNGISAGQSIPHVSLHIIPRKEGDGLDFQWQPKQISKEDMADIQSKIQNGIKNVDSSKDKVGNVVKDSEDPDVKIVSKKPLDDSKDDSLKDKKDSSNKEEKKNYLWDQMQRIP